jgi:hypothetical protein
MVDVGARGTENPASRRKQAGWLPFDALILEASMDGD